MPNVKRLFIATFLEANLQQQAHNLQQQIARHHLPFRWVPGPQLHLTWAFLGDVPTDQIPAIKTSLLTLGTAYTPLTITMDTLAVWPSPSYPRVLVWAGQADHPAMLKALALNLQLLAAPPYKATRPSFIPHITLARAKRGKAKHLEIPTDIKAIEADWTLEHLVLVESQLTPQGPLYTPLETVPLSKNKP